MVAKYLTLNIKSFSSPFPNCNRSIFWTTFFNIEFADAAADKPAI